LLQGVAEGLGVTGFEIVEFGIEGRGGVREALPLR
jgi:hypothetical protein